MEGLNVLKKTIRAASGNLTAGETSNAVSTAGFRWGTVFLDVTTLTTPDADDEVDFFVQTTYDDGANWVDVENFHFDTANNGQTPKRFSLIDEAKDGPGTVKSILGSDPAAGVEWSLTVPDNTLWSFRSIFATLVADGTVANRNPHLVIDDGTNILTRVGLGVNITAGQTANLYWMDTVAKDISVNLHIQTTYPRLPRRLPAGFRARTITVSLQGGDNWGAPRATVEEWHDPRVVTDGTIRDNLKSYSRPLGTALRIKTAVTGATAPTYAYTASALLRR